MKLSIIIPVYNKLDNLKALLFCLARQINKEFEVIISDDGSSDDILGGIKDFIDNANFKIKYLFQKDIGFRAGQARNNGARVAMGEYLIFLDQDILVPENFTEIIYKEIDKNKVLIFRTILISLEEKLKILEVIKIKDYNFEKILEKIAVEKKEQIMRLIRKDSFKSFKHIMKLRKKGPSTLGLFVIPKEIFIKINGFDEEFSGYGSEDVEFSDRLYLNGIKSKMLKVRTVHLYHKSLIEVDKANLNENDKRREYKKLIRNKVAIYGFNNRKDKDEVIYKELN